MLAQTITVLNPSCELFPEKESSNLFFVYTIRIMFEWDDAKATANLAKHGVSFDAVHRFDWARAVEFEDDREDYGEQRMVTIGWIDGNLHTMTYTWRGENIRVINLRRSNKQEYEAYAEAKPKT
jgi:uncharacterized DUF497 family protein